MENVYRRLQIFKISTNLSAYCIVGKNVDNNFTPLEHARSRES